MDAGVAVDLIARERAGDCEVNMADAAVSRRTLASIPSQLLRVV